MTWEWLLKSDAGLALRVGIGVSIFALLALADWHRNRDRATRWREYAFLLGCVAVAVAYGILHDQVTTSISWEYFAYGKGVAEQLPPDERPNSPAFRWEAAKIGMKATWTAGLVIGVALLVANNPRKDGRPRLGYRELAALVPMVLAVTVLASTCLGVAGYLGAFLPINSDFRELMADDAWRPRRFMAVYGVHLGGYVGGILGTTLAVARVLRERRRRAAPL